MIELKEQDSVANLTQLLLNKYHPFVGKQENPPSIEKIVEYIASYYEDIISCMPGNVYWLDKEGVTVGCNKNVLNMFGLKSIAEFKGLTFEKMAEIGGWLPKAVQSFKADTLEVIRTGKAKLNIEEPPISYQDGKFIYFLTSRVPLFDHSGAVVGVVGISIDISDRKRMEEELRTAKARAEVANRAKSEFIAVASHELRIPLTGILGVSEFLKEEDLSSEERNEYIRQLSKSSKHLLTLINDILDFAKLEADKFELNLAPLNFKKLIEETVLMLTAAAKIKNLEIFIEYAPDIPCQILADSRALRQIVTNLLGNAIKFTHQGYIQLRIHCLSQTLYSARISISVEDTGIGIPSNKLDIIFDRFSQLSSPYTRASSHAGTGLGLAIVKKLVELMNGQIYVTSEFAKGSAFTCIIDFPLQSSAIQFSPWDDYKNSVRVLIVDDTPRGDVLRKQLGSNWIFLVSGKDAFNAIAVDNKTEDPYDIIIVDEQLHTSDPLKLIKLIQQQKEIHQPMPVLLMAYGSIEDKQTAISAGFFKSITKPIAPLEFQIFITTAWEEWIEQNKKFTLHQSSSDCHI